MWPYVTVRFWEKNLPYLLPGGPTPHSVAVIVLFLVSNAGLTLLQFVWARKLIKQMVKLFGGGGSGAEKGSKKAK